MLEAIHRVEKQVLACFSEPGTVTVRVAFAGDGHVLGVRIMQPGEGSAQTSITTKAVLDCVSAQVARTSIAPFRKAEFLVQFPYSSR